MREESQYKKCKRANNIFLTLSRFANTGMYDRELTATARAALLVFACRGSVDCMKDRVTCTMKSYNNY